MTGGKIIAGLNEALAFAKGEKIGRVHRFQRTASVDRSPEGEKPQALSAKHESAVPERQTPATEGDS